MITVALVPRALGVTGLALGLACSFTPLPVWVARAIAPAARLEPADAIVVLGAEVAPDGRLSARSLSRTVHGLRLYRQGLAPLLVLSGSPPRDGGPSEAAARAGLAAELGVPSSAVLTASGSTTGDEARRLGPVLASRRARRILLVSEAQHLARASRLFAREGLEVLPAPADGVPDAGSPEARLWLTREIAEELAARAVARLTGSR